MKKIQSVFLCLLLVPSSYSFLEAIDPYIRKVKNHFDAVQSNLRDNYITQAQKSIGQFMDSCRCGISNAEQSFSQSLDYLINGVPQYWNNFLATMSKEGKIIEYLNVKWDIKKSAAVAVPVALLWRLSKDHDTPDSPKSVVKKSVVAREPVIEKILPSASVTTSPIEINSGLSGKEIAAWLMTGSLGGGAIAAFLAWLFWPNHKELHDVEINADPLQNSPQKESNPMVIDQQSDDIQQRDVQQNEIENLRQANQQLQNQICQQTARQNEALQNQKDQLTAMKEQLNQFKNDVVSLRPDFSEEKAKFTNWFENYQKQKQEQLGKAFFESQQQIEKLTQQVNVLQNEKKEWDKTRNEQVAQIEQLTKNRAKAEETWNEDTKAKEQKYSSQVQELTKQIDELNQVLQQQKDAAAKAQQQSAEELEKIRAEVEARTRAAEEKQKESQALTDQIETLKKELESYRANSDEVSKNLTQQYQEELNKKEAEIQQRTGELEELNQSLSAQQVQIEKLNQQILDAEATKANLEECNKLVEEQTSQLTELQNQIDQMHQKEEERNNAKRNWKIVSDNNNNFSIEPSEQTISDLTKANAEAQKTIHKITQEVNDLQSENEALKTSSVKQDQIVKEKEAMHNEKIEELNQKINQLQKKDELSVVQEPNNFEIKNDLPKISVGNKVTFDQDDHLWQDLQNEKIRLNQDLKNAKEKIDSLEQQIQENHEGNQTAALLNNEELDRIKSENEDLQRQIDALESNRQKTQLEIGNEQSQEVNESISEFDIDLFSPTKNIERAINFNTPTSSDDIAENIQTLHKKHFECDPKNETRIIGATDLGRQEALWIFPDNADTVGNQAFEDKLQSIRTANSSSSSPLKTQKYNEGPILNGSNPRNNVVSVDLKNVKIIESNAFCGNNQLQIVLGDHLREIKESAFARTAVREINFPDLTKVGLRAFDGCGDLRTVELSAKDLVIEEFAFYNCYSLKRVNISSAKKIGSEAFSECNKLEQVILPGDALNRINDGSFNKNAFPSDMSIKFCIDGKCYGSWSAVLQAAFGQTFAGQRAKYDEMFPDRETSSRFSQRSKKTQNKLQLNINLEQTKKSRVQNASASKKKAQPNVMVHYIQDLAQFTDDWKQNKIDPQLMVQLALASLSKSDDISKITNTGQIQTIDDQFMIFIQAQKLAEILGLGLQGHSESCNASATTNQQKVQQIPQSTGDVLVADEKIFISEWNLGKIDPKVKVSFFDRSLPKPVRAEKLAVLYNLQSYETITGQAKAENQSNNAGQPNTLRQKIRKVQKTSKFGFTKK